MQAAQLAVEEINAKGGMLGRQVALEVVDDGSRADGAVKAFTSLTLQQKVNVTSGGQPRWTSPSMPGTECWTLDVRRFQTARGA